MHELLHPSLLNKLPSSHCSLGSTNPSPHFTWHVSTDVSEPPDQTYPCSVDHDELQPSLSALFPSSHDSTPITFAPSPQAGPQVSACAEEPPEQEYPDSTVQEDEQPSRLLVLPSSHPSGPTLRPSPQIAVHESACVKLPPVHE